MTDFPIKPPSLAIIKKWIIANGLTVSIAEASAIASLASRLGADQELEACCEWLHWQNLATHQDLIPSLRAARRPKPPSRKQRGLSALKATNLKKDDPLLYQEILNAIEGLPND